MFQFLESNMIVIQAPEDVDSVDYGKPKPKVFLAGSIEMGKATPWQDEIIEFYKNDPVIFMNPRRSDWDSSWYQSEDNRVFREQVEWELNSLEKADFVFMYFDPSTKSPISLLELGLFSKKGSKMVVCCPEGFWRKGNVDIVCERMGVTRVDDFQRATMTLLGMIHSWRPPNPSSEDHVFYIPKGKLKGKRIEEYLHKNKERMQWL